MQPSPIRVAKVPRGIFGRLGGVNDFCISIPAYDIASSRKVLDDMIDNVLETCVADPRWLFLSITALVFVVFIVLFRRTVGVCSAGHRIYTDGVFDSILHDVDDFGCGTYNSIRSQSTGVDC